MPGLLLSRRERTLLGIGGAAGRGFLFLVTSVSLLAVLFIFYFIGKDAIPFFQSRGFREFFSSTHWYPSNAVPEYGCLALFVGSGLVTLGATIFAVPIGVAAAVCLSDILPFWLRQLVKPVIEILAAIPSVAYGFFALVVLAPLLQSSGGRILSVTWWAAATALGAFAAVVMSDSLCPRFASRAIRGVVRLLIFGLILAALECGIARFAGLLGGLHIASGTNALNVSLVLGIMALPTVVSVSEDALQAVGRDLREGSYALGATRAETLCRAVIPAASSGIAAAVILGVMRAVGETMVVWMASGNAAQIPKPWYNLLSPVRTLTATIAGDMGEADQVTGSDRYHVLFAMGLCLVAFAFVCNMASEAVVRRQRMKLKGQ